MGQPWKPIVYQDGEALEEESLADYEQVDPGEEYERDQQGDFDDAA